MYLFTSIINELSVGNEALMRKWWHAATVWGRMGCVSACSNIFFFNLATTLKSRNHWWSDYNRAVKELHQDGFLGLISGIQSNILAVNHLYYFLSLQCWTSSSNLQLFRLQNSMMGGTKTNPDIHCAAVLFRAKVFHVCNCQISCWLTAVAIKVRSQCDLTFHDLSLRCWYLIFGARSTQLTTLNSLIFHVTSVYYR